MASRRAQLTVAGRDWTARVTLAVPGEPMAANAALAIATVARLGWVTRAALQQAIPALTHCAPAGRMETVSRHPWIVIDGAHTAASTGALARTVAELGAPRIHLLLSCSSSKDIDAVLAPLLPLADAVTATCADADYSIAAQPLAEHIRRLHPHVEITTVTNTADALAHATADQPDHTLVLATGSVYLAGAVRRLARDG